MKKMLVPFLFLCGAQTALAGTFNGGGWPNPDAYCEANGGRLIVMERNPLGDEHYCQLGTALIESFTLVASSDPDNAKIEAPRTAGQVFLTHPAPTAPAGDSHPEGSYCQQVSGQIKTLRTTAGKSYEICSFSDGTAIETKTLFLGPEDQSNSQLTALLKRLNEPQVSRKRPHALQAPLLNSEDQTCYQVAASPDLWDYSDLLCVDKTAAADGTLTLTFQKDSRGSLQFRYPLLVNDKARDGRSIRVYGFTDDVSPNLSLMFVRFEGLVESDGTESGTLVIAGQNFVYRSSAGH